jgi:hypothetical protein
MGFENDENDDDMMENKTMDYLILAKSIKFYWNTAFHLLKFKSKKLEIYKIKVFRILW